MKISKKSFRKIEMPLAIFTAAILLLAGWQTLRLSNLNNQTDNLPNINQPSENSPPELTAKYKNAQIGIEFYYPKDWLVQEKFINQKDITSGLDITAKSPSGLVININGRYSGSQPAVCDKNIYDKPHITSSCSTLEVTGKEYLPVSTPEGDIFLVAAKFTPPNSKGRSQHVLFLTSDPNVALSQNPLVGSWPNYGTVNTGTIYLDFSLSGVNNSDPGYYRTADVLMAGKILKTFNLF